MSHIQGWQARSRVGRSDQKFQKGTSPKSACLQLILSLLFSELILTSRLCDFNSSVTAQWASMSSPFTFSDPKVRDGVVGEGFSGFAGGLEASLVLWALRNFCLCFSGV